MKTEKKFLITAVVIIMSLLFSSCGAKSEVVNKTKNKPDEVVNNSDKTKDNLDVKNNKTEKSADEKEKLKLDRELLEEARKKELGEFYVPLPELGKDLDNPKIDARGLYITESTAGKSVNEDNIDIYIQYIKALEEKNVEKINSLKYIEEKINTLERVIAIAAATEINALVINVKNDSGIVTYSSDIEIVKNIDSHTKYISNTEQFMKLLDKYDIYPIARIVTFKDPYFAKNMLKHSIQLKTGGVWYDYSGTSWINPFDKYVWEYNIAIAKEAALKGFKEIQFDYVRFPDDAKVYNSITTFPGRNGMEKDEAIGKFLQYAKESLKDYNVHIGADVFGMITKSWDDYPEDIGQSWIEMAPYVDYMCPMIYPSHYGPGWYGFDIPDAQPYGVVKGSMEEALEKKSIQNDSAEIRPWIQDFTASWVRGHISYGPKQVREQILASKELGINGYMVWNPSNKYSAESFIPREEEKNKDYPIDRGDVDFRNRTPADAAKEYYSAEYNERFLMVYFLTPIADRTDDFDEFEKQKREDEYDLLDYEVFDYRMIDNDNAAVTVMYKYEKTAGEEKTVIEQKQAEIKTIRENGIWKIKRVIDEANKENKEGKDE